MNRIIHIEIIAIYFQAGRSQNHSQQSPSQSHIVCIYLNFYNLFILFEFRYS